MAREMYLVGVDDEELKPDPKPEGPKTPKGKWENYWYHYKWHTLGAITAAIVLTVLIVQMVTKEKPDYELVVVTKNAVLQETLDHMEAALEQYGRDLNGDGQVDVRIQNIWLGESQDQMAVANQQRFVLSISTGDAMFYAFTPEVYQDRILTQEQELDDYHFFDELGVQADGVSEDGRYWNWKGDPLQQHEWVKDIAPEDLYFGVRTAAGVVGGDKPKRLHDDCMALLKAYITKKPLAAPGGETTP